jgi:hypothetical protein
MMHSTDRKTVSSKKRRPTVAVIYEDVTNGYRYADWFALHGYQATLTSAVPQLDHRLRELRPDVIVVGLSSFSTPLQKAVPHLKKTCPQVPIIAMLDGTSSGEATGHSPVGTFGADVFMCDSLDPPSPIS